MPTLIFSVEPDTRTDDGSGDIVLRTFANISRVSVLTKLIVDQDIILSPAFHNHSTFGSHRLVAGVAEFDILLSTAFANVSEFGGDTELTEAPPDAVILLAAAFVNVSTFGEDTELTVAPPDEIIRLSIFTNASTFGSATFMTVAEGEGGDDYDAVADYQPAGSVPN